jgi:hypothetical protein
LVVRGRRTSNSPAAFLLVFSCTSSLQAALLQETRQQQQQQVLASCSVQMIVAMANLRMPSHVACIAVAVLDQLCALMHKLLQRL